jgi:hypothetical protein
VKTVLGDLKIHFYPWKNNYSAGGGGFSNEREPFTVYSVIVGESTNRNVGLCDLFDINLCYSPSAFFGPDVRAGRKRETVHSGCMKMQVYAPPDSPTAGDMIRYFAFT